VCTGRCIGAVYCRVRYSVGCYLEIVFTVFSSPSMYILSLLFLSLTQTGTRHACTHTRVHKITHIIMLLHMHSHTLTLTHTLCRPLPAAARTLLVCSTMPAVCNQRQRKHGQRQLHCCHVRKGGTGMNMCVYININIC